MPVSFLVEHLGEFLYQVCSAELREAQQKNLPHEVSKDFTVENTMTSSHHQPTTVAVQRPEHFYVYVGFRGVFYLCEN